MKEKICEYLNWKATYASRASTCYKIWLEYFVKLCGEREVEKYTVSDIIRYHQWLESRFSSYCIQFAMVVIKNFFRYCKYNNVSCLSPELIRLPRIRAKSHRAITEEEYTKIISIIPENEFLSLRDLVAIRLLWDTGIRVSELCDLDTSHIDPKNQSAVINTKMIMTDIPHSKPVKKIFLRAAQWFLNYFSLRIALAI